MYIILGGTGHVGGAVADELIRQGEKVTIVSHDPGKKKAVEEKGARLAVADAHDIKALHDIFRTGKRLFVLNPPAPPSSDIVTEEQHTVAAMLEALKDSGIEKIVAESTYGAQPGEGIGDLGVLYDLEQGLKRTGIPATIIRAAYYMSNWQGSLETATKEGIVHTLFPVDFKLPMAAPEDIGKIAAHLIQTPVSNTGSHYVEGPEQYSANDVAAAFSKALNKPVKAVETPEAGWNEAWKAMGYSEKGAESMSAMTKLTLDKLAKPESPDRGIITLEEYIKNIVLQNQE